MKHIIILAMLLLAGCASQMPAPATPSGKAEGVFALSVDDTQNRIASWCVDRGYDVREATSTRVVCTKVITGGPGFALQASFGGPGSSEPHAVVTFTMLKVATGTRVIASAMAEIEQRNGHVERLDAFGNRGATELQVHLRNMGAQ